jgi:hypothetical protein
MQFVGVTLNDIYLVVVTISLHYTEMVTQRGV